MMSKAQKQPAASTGRNKMTWRRFRRYIPIYVIMLPGLIYLFINNYMPLPGLVVAFKQYNARKVMVRLDPLDISSDSAEKLIWTGAQVINDLF